MAGDAYARELAVADAIVSDLNTNIAPISGTVTAATNASPIQVTTDAAHTLATGQIVTITGALGNTAANYSGTVTVVDATNFTLDGTTGTGAYTSGGVWANTRFTATRGYRYEYKLTELNILRVDVRVLPDSETGEESRGGTTDRYHIEIATARNVSIQRVAALTAIASLDALVNLSKRIIKRYPVTRNDLPGLVGLVQIVANEPQLYDEGCLDAGYFQSRVYLTLQEFVEGLP
jgi:hypothetical protein